MTNNNGSAFAGLNGNTLFYNITWRVRHAVWAVSGWQSQLWRWPARWLPKRKRRLALGTLPTHTPLFIVWLIAVIIIVGALNFIPALALGPIVEHLMLWH